MYLRDIKN